MGESLRAVWEQVTDLLSAGVSIIPVRDRQVGDKPPKTPYALWKQYQSRVITPDELWHQMEEHQTTAIAIICGAVSGNLEAIDIDVKNWAGIDARLFEAIRDIYPDLFNRLRVHSTPSGGYHILYRVEKPTGIGNQKLATSATSTQAGIETRGEGGYIVAPPSLGYQVYRNVTIPTITLEQRESIIAIAKSFNEKTKAAPAPTVARDKKDYYDENPFDHFNASPAAEDVLLDQGWKVESSKSTGYRYFIRPGKDKGISASFSHHKRLYRIFTSSTILDGDRSYQPATLLSLLRFSGDNKATYHYLVEQGYGKIKLQVEKAIVKAKALSGEDLPANISGQAKILYLDTRTQLQEKYPHGVYWDISEKGDISINREKLYHVAGQLGFRLYKGQAVQVMGYLVTRISERHFYDSLKAYIGLEEETQNAYEAFIQRSGEFSLTRIGMLEDTDFLRCRKDLSYKFFRNGYVEIVKEGYGILPYLSLAGKLIWADQVADRDFSIEPVDPQGLYYQFLHLAVGISPYLWRIIGYLCHDYKDETTPYIIVLTESCPDPKQGGGTGKNIFTLLVGQSTTVKNIAGSQAQLNEKFLQAWNYERVLAIHDIPKHFNFGFLKELAGGSGTLKKLFKDELSLTVKDLPKLVLSSNYSFVVTDGGLKRRMIPLEFSSFFTKTGGVDIHFNKMFPYDWNANDWLQYDTLIIEAIVHYLKGKGRLEPNPLTEDGWLKQFDQTHMQLTREFIQQNWEYWLRIGFISNDTFRTDYSKFCTENNIDRKFALSSMRMNQALDDWATHYKALCINNYVKRDLVGSIRGRLFEVLAAPF